MSNLESNDLLQNINNTLLLILEELKKSNNKPQFKPPNIMDLFGGMSQNINEDEDEDVDEDEVEDEDVDEDEVEDEDVDNNDDEKKK